MNGLYIEKSKLSYITIHLVSRFFDRGLMGLLVVALRYK